MISLNCPNFCASILLTTLTVIAIFSFRLQLTSQFLWLLQSLVHTEAQYHVDLFVTTVDLVQIPVLFDFRVSIRLHMRNVSFDFFRITVCCTNFLTFVPSDCRFFPELRSPHFLSTIGGFQRSVACSGAKNFQTKFRQRIFLSVSVGFFGKISFTFRTTQILKSWCYQKIQLVLYSMKLYW